MMFQKAKTVKTLSNILIGKKTPVSLIHFLTNRCNARCSFCFIDFDNPKTFAGELTLNEIDLFTKNLGDTLLNVNFTGGEPFARKDIIDIAKIYIKNTTIQSIYITTNASLPNRILNFVNEINNYNSNIELNIQISIDDMPERHNAVRKIDNLFESCLRTFNDLKNLNNEKIKPSVSITVSEENCENIESIFNFFVYDCKITSLKCCIVRDEGVYKTAQNKKDKILKAYTWLTNEIRKLKENKQIVNYGNSLQGKIHNKKDDISWEMVKKIYKDNSYISPCHASSLFGVITADGKVYPCEILEDKFLGDIRKNNYDFLKIWNSKKNSEVKKFIKETKCRCTYECAISFNIVGNWRYQHKLISSLLTKY